MPTERPRITITMSEDQLERVKEFQYSNRMNQTQAILHLIQRGFSEMEKQIESTEEKNAASEPVDTVSEAAIKEQVSILTALLESAGIVGDISDNDLAFLQGIVIAVKAHFKERNESLE